VKAANCAEQGACQQKLIDFVRGNQIDTVVGPLSWDETGKPKGAHMIQQWIGNEIKIVLPANAKEADFLYPKPAW
jgi:branched-chain amino acid transport system substrate-binding protein